MDTDLGGEIPEFEKLTDAQRKEIEEAFLELREQQVADDDGMAIYRPIGRKANVA